ncbi:hypothetical protein [Haloglycomyces albus]|uniref:hypothetical protein n=1 Tax=Haloglycomyces albus TaxID=526067 RepID=UPI00046D4576|nr:hypothetical protein [Haloglycomyces albus]
MTATAPILFSEDYYNTVIGQFGYSTFEMKQFNFDFAGLSDRELNTRYLCHHHGDKFAAAPASERIITTGFGMSGPPHMATVSHIQKIIRFQQNRENCQIVLGDLDAYNGRRRDFNWTRELAEKFTVFTRRLGFDTARGVLRDQTSENSALRNMYLVGRYATDNDFDAAEEDNHSYYCEQGIVDASMTFRRRLSLTLMASDFITLGQNYRHVVALLGIDEHKYVRFAQTILDRFNKSIPLHSRFNIGAIYCRMTSGFNGYPKFSKSIPGSAIHVESPDDEIYSRITADSTRQPEKSPVFQLMCQVNYCSYDDLNRLYSACTNRSPVWARERRTFADYLIALKHLWPQ